MGATDRTWQSWRTGALRARRAIRNRGRLGEDDQGFFKISNSCASRLLMARSARTSGWRATSMLPTSATSCAYCQRQSSLGLMPNSRAAACVLRLSEAGRSASVLKASSYLLRLSGDAALILAVITEENTSCFCLAFLDYLNSCQKTAVSRSQA